MAYPERAQQPYGACPQRFILKSMKQLIIVNDPPYGTERAHNALRPARSLVIAGEEVRVFLMGDAVGCAWQISNSQMAITSLDRMIDSCKGR